MKNNALLILISSKFGIRGSSLECHFEIVSEQCNMITSRNDDDGGCFIKSLQKTNDFLLCGGENIQHSCSAVRMKFLKNKEGTIQTKIENSKLLKAMMVMMKKLFHQLALSTFL